MHITVIAKEPRPGAVKTRLCPPCTPGQAAEIAAAALSDTLDGIDRVAAVLDVRGGPSCRRTLLFEGDASNWLRPGYDAVAQRGDGLAERLANGFDDLGPGIIVGMETPQAIDTLVCAVPALLEGRDVVGLASDGGYWVIGLHRVDRAVFYDIPMSSTNTGVRQLSQLHRLGRGVTVLPMARDLDTFDDVVAAAARSEPGRLTVAARSLVDAVLAHPTQGSR